MANIEESQILQLIREGKDRQVVPLLYKKVLPVFKNYIGKSGGNREDAEDIFHDVLLMFYELVISNHFKDIQNVYGYLYRMCMTSWLYKTKKNKSIPLTDNNASLLTEFNPGMFEENDITKDENILKQLFSQIGDKCVELLTYTVYYDMLMEDIMIRMNFNSVDAVRMQHMRCREKLRNEIEKKPALMDKLRKI